MAVDRRTSWILVDKVRSQSRRQNVQATDRKIRKSARFVFRRRNLVEAGGPRGKLTGMWEDGLYFGICKENIS